MSMSIRTSLAVNVNGIEWPVTMLSIRNFSGHGCARSASVISTVDAAAPPSAGQWRPTTLRISRWRRPPPDGCGRRRSGSVYRKGSSTSSDPCSHWSFECTRLRGEAAAEARWLPASASAASATSDRLDRRRPGRRARASGRRRRSTARRRASGARRAARRPPPSSGVVVVVACRPRGASPAPARSTRPVSPRSPSACPPRFLRRALDVILELDPAPRREVRRDRVAVHRVDEAPVDDEAPPAAALGERGPDHVGLRNGVKTTFGWAATRRRCSAAVRSRRWKKSSAARPCRS